MARVSDKTKELVTERAKRHCEYCRAPLDFTTDLFAIEHIIPVVEDGGDDADNLALACSGCNMYKHDFTTGIDPATGEYASLFILEKMCGTFILVGITPSLKLSAKPQRVGRL